MTNIRFDQAAGNEQTADPATGSGHDDFSSDSSPSFDPVIARRIGSELASARATAHRELADCAQQLHLPVRVLRKLEEGDYTGIDTAVYLRNYLGSYARCLGLPQETVAEWIADLAPLQHKPELVATGGIPRSQYLFERYASALTYVVLTAVIVVPLVWLGLEGGLNHGLAKVESLEPAVSGQSIAASGHVPARPGSVASSSVPAPFGEKPLMASMAPFLALDKVDQADRSKPPAPVQPVTAAPARNEFVLRVQLSEPSWVEVSTDDGKQLAYQLMPAGTDKSFHSSNDLQVRLGNAPSAKVLLDGKPVDLKDYRHAMLARFRVVNADGKVNIQAD